ncbi:hypothetical protein EMPS_08310 [Entomortierella parvispora]|uniref:Uncharacterized protein n=1 Tax=Entomortierella parvispora TaxID=205924 RepID=A0A9P3LZB2_9FUNG|nr:hypothetical protein EMPS_08310 [Entomortierella parvispora]
MKKKRWPDPAVYSHVRAYIKNRPVLHLEPLQKELNTAFPNLAGYFSLPTLCSALRHDMAMSRKVLRRRAKELGKTNRSEIKDRHRDLSTDSPSHPPLLLATPATASARSVGTRDPVEKLAKEVKSNKRLPPSPTEYQSNPERRWRLIEEEAVDDEMERDGADPKQPQEKEQQQQQQPPRSGMPTGSISMEETLQSQRPDIFQLPSKIQISLNFKRGEPRGAPRSIKAWPTPTWTHYKEDGFSVLVGRISNHLRNLQAIDIKNRGLYWPGSVPYIQRSHSTKQMNYPSLNEDNCYRALAKAWYNEKKRVGDEGDVQVKVFVYLKDKNIENQAIQHTQVHASTETWAAAPMARRMDKSQATPVPSQETERRGSLLVPGADETCQVRVQMCDNQWVRLRIHMGDLKQALGLGPAS